MKNSIVLVTGGARSGKSAFAEGLVRSCGGRRFYIATAPVCDAEMAERVRLHRDRRAADGWTTIEEQVDLPRALKAAAEQGAEAVLVDCLTLWINNLLYHDETLDEGRFAERCREMLECLRALPLRGVLVLSEVGLGMVPGNALARRFRDLSGRCAQLVAAEADEVFLVVAGIPVKIKG